MRSSASQTPMPATQRRCTETVAAMARRKRRMAPQRNHTDSVITFYNRDTEKARDKMGNKMKKFRQISTNAHRMGHRRKNKRTRSAARRREKAGHILSKPRDRATAIPRVGTKRQSISFQSPRDGATAVPRVDAKKQGSSQRNRPAAREQPKTALQHFAVS